MDKIGWCKKKKDGLHVVPSNHTVALAYMKKAELALESVEINIFKEWKIATAYYAMYFSLYALLMKIGVASEIHSCTIAFAKKFLSFYFTEEDLVVLDTALRRRIENQYYVDKILPDNEFELLLKKTPLFFAKCSRILAQLTDDDISKIRTLFEQNKKISKEKN